MGKPDYAKQVEILDELAKQWVGGDGEFSDQGAFLDLDSTPPVLYLAFGNLAMLTRATAIINIPIIMGAEKKDAQAEAELVNELNQSSGPLLYTMIEDESEIHLHGRISIPEVLLSEESLAQAAEVIKWEIHGRDWQPIAEEIGGMIAVDIPAMHLKRLKED